MMSGRNPSPPRYVEEGSDPGHADLDRAHVLGTLRSLLEGGRREEVNEEEVVAWCCALWDMASTEEYARFLHENHVVSVLLTVVGREHATSRLQEVCMGTLANLAAFPGICHDMTWNDTLVDTILGVFLEASDPMVLSEVVRFLSVSCSAAHPVGTLWLERMQETVMMTRILFILSSSLHEQLLERSVGLLLCMLYRSSVSLNRLVDMEGTPVLYDLLRQMTDREESESICAVETILRALVVLAASNRGAPSITALDGLPEWILRVLKTTYDVGVSGSALNLLGILADIRPLPASVMTDGFLGGLLLKHLSYNDPALHRDVWILVRAMPRIPLKELPALLVVAEGLSEREDVCIRVIREDPHDTGAELATIMLEAIRRILGDLDPTVQQRSQLEALATRVAALHEEFSQAR